MNSKEIEKCTYVLSLSRVNLLIVLQFIINNEITRKCCKEVKTIINKVTRLVTKKLFKKTNT